MTVIYKIPRG